MITADPCVPSLAATGASSPIVSIAVAIAVILIGVVVIAHARTHRVRVGRGSAVFVAAALLALSGVALTPAPAHASTSECPPSAAPAPVSPTPTAQPTTNGTAAPAPTSEPSASSTATVTATAPTSPDSTPAPSPQSSESVEPSPQPTGSADPTRGALSVYMAPSPVWALASAAPVVALEQDGTGIDIVDDWTTVREACTVELDYDTLTPDPDFDATHPYARFWLLALDADGVVAWAEQHVMHGDDAAGADGTLRVTTIPDGTFRIVTSSHPVAVGARIPAGDEHFHTWAYFGTAGRITSCPGGVEGVDGVMHTDVTGTVTSRYVARKLDTGPLTFPLTEDVFARPIEVVNALH